MLRISESVSKCTKSDTSRYYYLTCYIIVHQRPVISVKYLSRQLLDIFTMLREFSYYQ